MPRSSVTSWENRYDHMSFGKWFACDYNYNKLFKIMHTQPGMVLLDIASGKGDVLAAAKAKGLVAIGMERKPETAAVCQRNVPGVKVILGSLQEIPFEDSYFDLVTCFDVMDFFSDPTVGMRELYRVLKPGGKTCLVLPNSEFVGLDPDKQLLDEFDAHFPLSKWKEMIAAADLKLCVIKYTACQQPALANKKKWVQSIKMKWDLFLARCFPGVYATQFICICQKKALQE